MTGLMEFAMRTPICWEDREGTTSTTKELKQFYPVLEISGRPVVRDDQKVYRATNL